MISPDDRDYVNVKPDFFHQIMKPYTRRLWWVSFQAGIFESLHEGIRSMLVYRLDSKQASRLDAALRNSVFVWPEFHCDTIGYVGHLRGRDSSMPEVCEDIFRPGDLALIRSRDENQWLLVDFS